MQKKKNNILFVLISVIIIVVILLTINAIKLFLKPTETVIVKNGELIKYEEVIGYIVRDETIIDTEDFDGVMKLEIEDANRIAKNGVVAKYVSKSEESLMKKIDELDDEIQEAMKNQQTIYSSDAKAIDATIQVQLYDDIRNCNNINLINENKSKLNNNIKKKAQIVGELSPAGSKVKELINQRNEYEKRINDSQKELKSPRAGLVSYRVDGFEEQLAKNKISDLNSDMLNSLKLNVNQVMPQTDDKIKIINNFECYIVMFMNSEESKTAKLNDKLYLRFENTGDRLIPATIEYIAEENEGRLITAKIETNIEELTKYRKINLDVVWWSYSGLKLHKSLLSKQTIINPSGDSIELNYVTIKKNSVNDIAYVKIIKEFGDYVIVDNYTNAEYIALGFTQENIEKFVTLKMYNEVIVEPKS